MPWGFGLANNKLSILCLHFNTDPPGSVQQDRRWVSLRGSLCVKAQSTQDDAQQQQLLQITFAKYFCALLLKCLNNRVEMKETHAFIPASVTDCKQNLPL